MRNRLLTFTLLLLVPSLFQCGRNKALTVPQTSVIIDGDLNEWNNIPLFSNDGDPIAVKISRSAEFMYVFIRFENRDYYRDAVRYGLSVYLDNEKKFRHAFGITYPTGLVNELAQIPGARRAYLENPAWSSMPENETIIQTIDEQMYKYVMLTKRDSKDIPDRASRQSVDGMRSLGIDVASDREGKTLAVEMQFPLYESRTKPYAPNIDKDGEAYLSVEINPPKLSEVMEEPDGALDPNMRGFDRVGRGAAGPNQRGAVQGAEQRLQDRMINAHMMGAYSIRRKINLSKN